LSGLSFGDDSSNGGFGGWGQASQAPPPVPAVHNNGFGNFSVSQTRTSCTRNELWRG
jgi:hypothetical protein